MLNQLNQCSTGACAGWCHHFCTLTCQTSLRRRPPSGRASRPWTFSSKKPPRCHPALAALLRLRLDPVGKSDSSAQVTDGVGVLQDREVVVQRRRTLPATAHAGQVPAVSGPGRHQQRPAAEVVAEVAHRGLKKWQLGCPGGGQIVHDQWHSMGQKSRFGETFNIVFIIW